MSIPTLEVGEWEALGCQVRAWYGWLDGRSRMACEELCPDSPGAVVLEIAEVIARSGEKRDVKGPRIIREMYIGCGVREHKCPLPGDAAIRVQVTSPLLSEAGDLVPH